MRSFFESRYALWLALPVGAALSLAFAPFEWWPLAILCLAYLFSAWQYTPPRRAAKFGFLFTAGIFLAGTYWLYSTIHEIGHAPAWIAIFLMFGMVAVIGGYCALLGYAIARWLRPHPNPPPQAGEGAKRRLANANLPPQAREGAKGWPADSVPPSQAGEEVEERPAASIPPPQARQGAKGRSAASVPPPQAGEGAKERLAASVPPPLAGEGREGAGLWFFLLTLPAAWTLLEWFRGWFLSGFPWFALGYSQTDSPLAGFAPIGGVYTISLLVAITAGALVALIGGSMRQRIVAALAIVLIWGSGAAVWKREWTRPVNGPLTVAVVQGAVPQDVKWSVEYRDSTLNLYRDLTLPHLGKNIILWPEAALPDMPEQLRDYLSYMWSAARANKTTLITGLLHFGENEDDVRNGLLSLDEDLQWYDKRRLVPFGEFFPVPDFVREWMRLRSLPYSDITPGARRQPALRAAGQKIGATICYEDAYGAEQLEVLKEATLLVNVTNDAWFGDTTAAPQHLQISRMRVMEAERPLLRAANDGISAIIDAGGNVEKTLPRFKPGVLTGVVQPRTGLTPYARVGNWPLVSFCTLILLFALYRSSKAERTAARQKGGTSVE